MQLVQFYIFASGLYYCWRIVLFIHVTSIIYIANKAYSYFVEILVVVLIEAIVVADGFCRWWTMQTWGCAMYRDLKRWHPCKVAEPSMRDCWMIFLNFWMAIFEAHDCRESFVMANKTEIFKIVLATLVEVVVVRVLTIVNEL